MTTTLKFLGASGFEVVGPSFRVLFDPFLRNNPVAPFLPEDLEDPDLILVSHAAWDHMGDAAEIAIRTGAPIVCPADVAEKMYEEGVGKDQVRPTIWGLCYEFGDIVVRPVENHHWTAVSLHNGGVSGVPLSFIIETEPGVRIYHFGDSAIFPGMKMIRNLYRPTVGLIGCSQTEGLPDPGAGRALTGEMNPDEAARAAEWLGVRHAVATHYMAPGPEAHEMMRRVPVHDSSGKRKAYAPSAGEVLTIEPVDWEFDSLIWGPTSDEFDESHRPPMADGDIPS